MLSDLLSRQIPIKALGILGLAGGMCPRKETPIWKQLLRWLALALLGAGGCLLDDWLVYRSGWGTTVQPFICIAITFVYLAVVRRMEWKQAVYCTVWSLITMEMTTQVFWIFERTVLFQIAHQYRGFVKFALSICFITPVYFFLRFAGEKWLRMDGKYRVNGQILLYVLIVLAVFLVTTNYRFIFWLLSYEPSRQSAMIEAFRLASGFMCLALLTLQNLMEKKHHTDQELEVVRRMCYRQQEQFQMSKENIEIINRKCHDMKHQIAALRTIRDPEQIDRQVEEMEQAVMIYDSMVRTGNSVLDVVLTEKSLYCEAHKINLTCLVDGKMLAFVDTVDLYTMFGNALDNAIESVMRQKDKQKRVIQVASYEEKGMLLIRFRNYCDQIPEMIDGVPVTLKQDKEYHGFGLKSIRYTAEKYGGGMSIQTGPNFFTLQILIPIHQE